MTATTEKEILTQHVTPRANNPNDLLYRKQGVVTHVVQIGKPPKQPSGGGIQHSQAQEGGVRSTASGSGVRSGSKATQSRFDAFDNDDDDDFFNDDDDGNLSDDSLTVGKQQRQGGIPPRGV
jgi:hypothetical protein